MRTLFFFFLLLTPLWAGMKVYDSVEEAPKSADLYMMVDGGSFVDVSSLPNSYRSRITKNEDVYIKVKKDRKGNWVIPDVKPKVVDEFKEFLVQEEIKDEVRQEPVPKKKSSNINLIKKKPVEVVKDEPADQSLNGLINHFKAKCYPALNKLVKQAKIGRAEGIIEGSLEKVKYYTAVGEAVQNGCVWAGVNPREDSRIWDLYHEFLTALRINKNELVPKLEAIKKDLVRQDNIPEAEEIDKLIRKDPMKIMFPESNNSLTPRSLGPGPFTPEYQKRLPKHIVESRLIMYQEKLTELKKRVEGYPPNSRLHELWKLKIPPLEQEVRRWEALLEN